ncbi:MAG: 2Fe-2S iron-sulfur cluster binding domain-containing protein [Gammaproteobacteria bacterium]|nr:2Fe-2S iron-sulfur cluster binding domain-containing protein [Gammaproteobacteria bacterium]
MKAGLTLRVNGAEHEIPEQWLGRRLLDYLRNELRLVSVKEGCGEGDCGACTVFVDGEPMCACLLLCGVVADRNIITVEGLAQDYRQRFAQLCEKHGGLQCGFCTPGFTMMSAWLTGGGTETGKDSLNKLVAGNICRCGVYQQLQKVLAELT